MMTVVFSADLNLFHYWWTSHGCWTELSGIWVSICKLILIFLFILDHSDLSPPESICRYRPATVSPFSTRPLCTHWTLQEK